MKKWYESKTVWFNLVVTLILIAEFVGDRFMDWAWLTILVAGIGNILLRVWFTSTEVEKSVK